MSDEQQRPLAGDLRRTYTRPVIEEHAEFETLALSCGKVNPGVDPDCSPYDGGSIQSS